MKNLTTVNLVNHAFKNGSMLSSMIDTYLTQDSNGI